MTALEDREIWLVAGSQTLYGPAVLEEIDDRIREVAASFDAAPEIPVGVRGCGVVASGETIRRLVIEANGDEATAFGTRVVVDAFERAGLEVEGIVACGGLPDRNPLLMEIFAGVTGRALAAARSHQAPALGAAMWGAVAAGTFDSIQAAAARMAHLGRVRYVARPEHRRAYDLLYGEYLRLHDLFGGGGDDVMRNLKRLQREVALQRHGTAEGMR